MIGTALAIAVAIQSQQVQRCGWEGNQWVCRTQQSAPSVAYDPIGSAQAGREQMEAIQNGLDQRRERERIETADRFRRTVGQLLSQGRCDEAVRMALDSGDISLAREAREFCAAP